MKDMIVKLRRGIDKLRAKKGRFVKKSKKGSRSQKSK